MFGRVRGVGPLPLVACACPPPFFLSEFMESVESVGAVVQLPDGAIIASHSWREMAAVASARAGFCMFRMSNRGLWRRIETMLQSYIRPFEHFPFSAVLAELYDDLAASAPAVQVLRG